MRLKRWFIYVVILLSVSMSGCILDSLEEVPLDIPITYPFDVSGTAVNLSEDGSFCLTDNELYMDYQSKMKDIKLLEITFRPTKVVPAALKGDVRLIIKKNNEQGEELFNYVITGITPASYLAPNIPYTLPLPAGYLSLVNTYLASKGTCFYVKVAAESITPVNENKSIAGQIDFVFRTTTDLGS